MPRIPGGKLRREAGGWDWRCRWEGGGNNLRCGSAKIISRGLRRGQRRYWAVYSLTRRSQRRFLPGQLHRLVQKMKVVVQKMHLSSEKSELTKLLRLVFCNVGG